MYKAKESYSFLFSFRETEEYDHHNNQHIIVLEVFRKTGGGLFKITGEYMLEEAFTFEKLLAAHKKCRRSKQHKKETISFEINLSANLAELSKKLLNKTYKIGKYKQFYIYEPKKRNIEALSYKDRVVLMAFCTNIIQPQLEKSLIYDNVACRKGKGPYFGIKRLQHFLRDYYKKFGEQGYFLKCDIRKYFQSIDHNILLNKLKQTELDNEDLWFVELLLNSKNADTKAGLPIGNQTSQWFGLFYLNIVDRLIKERLRVKYYVRYMDDMILIHTDKDFLFYCKQQIEKIVTEELNLQLNNKTQISQLRNGIDFLGFRHVLLKNGKLLTLLRGQAKCRMKKKIKLLGKLRDNEKINNEFINLRLNAFNAHLCHSNAKKYYINLLKHYKFKIKE